MSKYSKLHGLLIITNFVACLFVTMDMKFGSTAMTQKPNFILRKSRKSQGVKSGEYVVLGVTTAVASKKLWH